MELVITGRAVQVTYLWRRDGGCQGAEVLGTACVRRGGGARGFVLIGNFIRGCL